MTDRLSMPLMPLMTPLSLLDTGLQETFNRIPSPCSCSGVEDNEVKDENNCEDEVEDDDDNNDVDDDEYDDDNDQRTPAHSRGVCGAVVILDIAQLSQISQQRLSRLSRLSHSCGAIIMIESDRVANIAQPASMAISYLGLL